jgi:hypothetical protein
MHGQGRDPVCYALMFPADSVQEVNDQIQWFAADVVNSPS